MSKIIRSSKAFYISKSNWNHNNMFPDFLYIDTNVVLEIIHRGHYHSQITDYVVEFGRRDGVLVWSEQLTTELYDYYQYQENEKQALRFYGHDVGKKYENRASDKNSIISAAQVKNNVDAAERLLDSIGVKIGTEDPQRLSNNAKLIHATNGNNLKDAYHIASAAEHDINNFLTLDSNSGNGFLRYDGINVYGPTIPIKNQFEKNNK